MTLQAYMDTPDSGAMYSDSLFPGVSVRLVSFLGKEF